MQAVGCDEPSRPAGVASGQDRVTRLKIVQAKPVTRGYGDSLVWHVQNIGRTWRLLRCTVERRSMAGAPENRRSSAAFAGLWLGFQAPPENHEIQKITANKARGGRCGRKPTHPSRPSPARGVPPRALRPASAAVTWVVVEHPVAQDDAEAEQGSVTPAIG